MLRKLNTGEEANKPTFTEYQSSTVIDDAQTRIIALKKELDEVTPQLKDYKEAYLKLQTQSDSITYKLQQNEELLEYMSRFQNKVAEDKKFKVVRAESHNDMKEREKRKLRATSKTRYPWTDYAVLTLRQEKRFTTPEDLWQLIDISYGTEKQIEKDGGKMTNIRWGAIHACWLAGAKATREGKKRKNIGGNSTTEQLIEVEGRLGLKNWVDENFKPLPQYRPLKVNQAV